MPSICLMRLPSESPKTRMKSSELRIGAMTVCVHSFRTRCDSRLLEGDEAAMAGDQRAHDAIALT